MKYHQIVNRRWLFLVLLNVTLRVLNLLRHVCLARALWLLELNNSHTLALWWHMIFPIENIWWQKSHDFVSIIPSQNFKLFRRNSDNFDNCVKKLEKKWKTMGNYYSTEAVETIQNLVESPGKKNMRKNLSDFKTVSINKIFWLISCFLHNSEFC